jgi:hypothetical protein
MTRVQLVFGREPHVDARLTHAESSVIRGVEWCVRSDGDWAGSRRFSGALLVGPRDP